MRPLPIAAIALLAAPLGQAEETSAHLGPVTGVALVGGQVYSVSQAGIFSGARRLAKPPFRVTSMAASKPLLLVGGGQPAASGEIAALEPDGHRLAKLRLGDNLVYSVAVAPDGKTAAAAMADGRVLTIDFPSLAPASVAEANRHQAIVRAVAFSPDGRWLVTDAPQFSIGDVNGLHLIDPRGDVLHPLCRINCSWTLESPDGGP
ncbi:MAG: hypothetical protein CMO43_06775, partial [Verrucomicrobiales bacterium]|nr:hypothetical protein [Verrucomicrobiales bacterium]